MFGGYLRRYCVLLFLGCQCGCSQSSRDLSPPPLQEERLQHANPHLFGLLLRFLSMLLGFRWLLRCPTRTSSTATVTNRVRTRLSLCCRTVSRLSSPSSARCATLHPPNFPSQMSLYIGHASRWHLTLSVWGSVLIVYEHCTKRRSPQYGLPFNPILWMILARTIHQCLNTSSVKWEICEILDRHQDIFNVGNWIDAWFV